MTNHGPGRYFYRNQHHAMRQLAILAGFDRKRTIQHYAKAEECGEVAPRKSNKMNLSGKRYAQLLWADGMKRGWLTKGFIGQSAQRGRPPGKKNSIPPDAPTKKDPEQ